MDSPAIPVEQLVVLPAVLLVLPVDHGARGDEGVDGIEVGERRLAGEGLLPGDEWEQGQIDQALSEASVRQRPNWAHERKGVGRHGHVREDTRPLVSTTSARGCAVRPLVPSVSRSVGPFGLIASIDPRPNARYERGR